MARKHALELFQSALEARERDSQNEAAIAFARYGLGTTLRALGRPVEAVALLEASAGWARENGKPDSNYDAELALARQEVGSSR